MPKTQDPTSTTSSASNTPPGLSQAVKFDVVVIGAGAAGCVVAGRIATGSKLCVLLLKAGRNDTDSLIHLPAGFAETAADQRDQRP